MSHEESSTERSILLAGDIICQRLPLSEWLRNSGHAVLAATRGIEACEIVDREGSRLGLIVLNFCQPELDCTRVLQTLMVKRLPERIPVWAIVSPFEMNDESRRNALASLGVAGFFDPFTSPEEILSRVKGALARHEERRRNPRIAVHLPVEAIAGEKRLLGHLTFLSRGGAFFQTPESLSRDTQLQIRFALPEISRSVQARARVLYAVEKRPADPVFVASGMGLRFEDLGQKNEAMIDSLIQERLAARLNYEAP